MLGRNGTDDLEALTSQLLHSHVGEQGLSFQGKSLKLNSAESASQVIEEIDKCENLVYLNLDGNTIGIDAAKEIGKSLSNHEEFKRALWKNMFTGRTKEEIPPALTHLGAGIIKAKANLVELDLSDNAFGPVGVEGIAELIRSPSFHTLQILRLNNNGLGTTGGKLLAKSLRECFESSGKKFALRIFEAGRNRLEDHGAVELARVFELLGTLTEISVPQNGIYRRGIYALSRTFLRNPHLKLINLSDNTPQKKGVRAIAEVLPTLSNLETLNLSDCLLKTEGAATIAKALMAGNPKLKVLLFDCNEIYISGGMEIIKAVKNKENIVTLNLNGNRFGSGIPNLINELKKCERYNALQSLSEDEGSGQDSDGSESQRETTDDSDGENKIEEIYSLLNNSSSHKLVTVSEFLNAPSLNNFNNLGENKFEILTQYLETSQREEFLRNTLEVLLAVSNLCENNDKFKSTQTLAASTSLQLFKFLFNWASKNDRISLVTNAILVQLRLIKAEEKSSLIDCNQDICVRALLNAMKSGSIPKSSCDMFNLFLEKRRVSGLERGDVTTIS